MGERMPQYLHLPLQVLWFDTEELMLIMSIYVMALTMGGYAGLVGLAGLIWYMKVKHNNPRGFLRHILYGSGVYTLEGYPSPFARRFYE